MGATAVPKAVSITPLSAVEPPDNAQETVPVFVPVTVKNALKVIVPAFHDLGNATLNCAFSSLLGSKSKHFNSGLPAVPST